MPIYKIQAPDGRVLSLEGPAGASEQEVIARAQQMYKPQATAPLPASAPQISPEAVFPGMTPQPSPVAAPLNTGASVPESDGLRPRYDYPVTGMGPFQPDPSLAAGFMDTARNVGRKQYELSGNIMDAGANFIDDKVSQAQFALTRLFTGDEAINARSANAPAELTVPESNTVSEYLRGVADKDFHNANIIAGWQQENPVDRSGRTTIEDIFTDPTNVPQIAKFGVETAVESAPEMALASIPVIGPLLFGGSMTQDIAEQRAQNNGGDVRDVSGTDLIEATPFAAGSAALERAGIKGLGSKGAGPVSRTLKASAKETGTEALQEPIELAGETLGTDKEATPMDYAKRSAAGAIGGATTGTTLKAGAETAKAVREATDLSGTNVEPFDLGAGTRQEIPQASQPPSQDRQQPAVKPASPDEPNKTPSSVVPGEVAAATPASPVAQQPVDPPAEARPEGAKQTEPPKVSRKKVVTPDGSMEIETEDEVVELDSLKRASGDIQPRDRKRATSDLQIQKIATELDPERLGESRTTDQGSPIVGEDGTIESGNGRASAIDQAYAANGESAQKYRQKLIAGGYNIEGFKKPVLIRRRKTQLTPEERVRFTSLSNKSAIAEMSSTEKARADATQIDDSLIDLHKGGEPDSADNQDFIQAFISKVTTGNESSAMIGPDKRLNQEGIKRAKAALVAKAYDDPELVENIFESADPEVKAIGNVLRDRAPEFAQLGAAVRRKETPERFDISKQLMEAVKIIRNAKRDGKRIRDVIEGTNQQSLIEEKGIDPTVEKLVRMMYRPELGRMLPQPTIDKILKQYATQAREQKANDLFGENKLQPADLLDSAYEKHTAAPDAPANGQGNLTFAEAETSERSAPREPATDTDGTDVRRDDDTSNSRIGKQRSKGAPDPDELAKTAGRKFENFATSKGTSLYRTAYVDLGMDPDLVTSKPADEQLQILSNALSDRFGMRIEVDKKMDRRAALDMLHNIYNNLSFISGVMGLPYKAIGLNGTLGIKLQEKLAGALGSYSPMEKLIRLPKKTNSFIHEWLHALDHHLLTKFGDISNGSLFSGVVRKDGVIDPHDGLQAAFAHLMHMVFYDKAMLASIKLDLEAKLTRAKTDASKADIERRLKELEAGNYKGINGKNNYYQGSKKLGNGNPYWTSPEEMLARVFEAYTAWKIENAGGDPASIAKGDMAYLSNVDDRLAQTFPKLADREAIFEAVDQFMSRLRESEMLGKDIDKTKPMMLSDMSILDSADWGYIPKYSEYAGKGVAERIKLFKRNLIEEQKREIKKWRAGVERLREAIADRRKMDKENPSSANSSLEWLRGMLFSTDRSVMHALETKYASSALKQLNDRVFTRPGQGEVVKQDFFFTTRNITAQYKKRLANLMRTYGSANTTKENAAENKNIRDILIGRTPKDATANQKKIAGSLRKLLDDMYEELKDAGVEIGYLRNQGYLSRKYITRKILANKEKFLEKAAEVYGLQFDQNVGEIIDDIVNDPELFSKYLKKMLREKPASLSITKKEAQELIKALAEGEVDDKMKERLEAILPDVRDFYANMAAMDWLTRIQFGSDQELENGSPSSGFTKKRALPPEADTILEEFLETDPFAIVDHYADLVGRRVGLQNAMKPKGKPSYTELLEELKSQGVSPKDIAVIKSKFDKIYGIDGSDNTHTGLIKNVLSIAHLGGMLSMLDLAALASLPERFTVVIKTKRVADLFKTVLYTMDQIAGTEDAREAREAAESIGIIMHEMAAAALDARMGGWKEIDLVEKISSRFFIANGLTMIDNSNRLVSFRIGKGYFEHMARKLVNPKTKDADKDLITREFAEYGIAPDDSVAFSKWLIGDVSDGNNAGVFDGFADVNKLRQTPFGMDLILALNRFNDQTVQRPTAADRPYASKNAIGSLVFAVTSFAFAFYENMVKAEAKKVAYVTKNYGALQGARQASLMALSWTPLLVATVIVNALRTALLDKDRWEELKKEDDVAKYLALRSMSSMGVLGPVIDFLVNMATGIRYQRDAATAISGAYISQYLKWLESLIAWSNVAAITGGKKTNTPNTNTQEYNLIKNTWKTIIAPSIVAGLTMMPGGKLFTTMAGLGIAGVGSSTLADNIATEVVGPKGEKTGGKIKSEPAEPKEAKEPKEANQ